MKDKILLALKTKFQNLGFGDKAFDGVATYLATTVTDEANIETAISGVENLLKSFQADADRIRTENAALKKQVAEKKPETVETPKPEGEAKSDNPMEELLKKVLAKVEGLESERTTQTHNERLVSKLKEKKVSEDYYSVAIQGRTFKDANEVDTYADALISAYEKISQDKTNDGLKTQPSPVMGLVKDPKTEVSPTMKEYLKEKENANKKTA